MARDVPSWLFSKKKPVGGLTASTPPTSWKNLPQISNATSTLGRCGAASQTEAASRLKSTSDFILRGDIDAIWINPAFEHSEIRGSA